MKGTEKEAESTAKKAFPCENLYSERGEIIELIKKQVKNTC